MSGLGGFIFDCDGVLFESRMANLAYYNVILDHFGETPVSVDQRERAHLCHTADSRHVLSVLLGSDRLPEALALAAALDFRRFVPMMEPEPGLTETLASLARRYPLAVATNRGGSMSEILSHFRLEKFFSAVITSRDVERPKPFPDMLLLAAAKLGLDVEQLLFVGDSELDRDAARAAGMKFVSYKGSVPGDLNVSAHRELLILTDR